MLMWPLTAHVTLPHGQKSHATSDGGNRLYFLFLFFEKNLFFFFSKLIFVSPTNLANTPMKFNIYVQIPPSNLKFM